jgi:hypothetical protein
VVIAHESERLESLLSSVASASRSLRLPSDHVRLALPARFMSDGVPVWTDDYSDLLSILRPPQG